MDSALTIIPCEASFLLIWSRLCFQEKAGFDLLFDLSGDDSGPRLQILPGLPHVQFGNSKS